MQIDVGILTAAAERWQRRSATRVLTQQRIQEGKAVEAESPERVQMRVERLSRAAAQRTAQEAVPVRAPVPLLQTIALERVIGTPDYLGMSFIEDADAVARCVCRIRIQDVGGRLVGYGTGFMVSPRLLMTNNHVLRTAQEAGQSVVDFDCKTDRAGREFPVRVFKLEPHVFFASSRELDYSLVAVSERSQEGTELRRYGWSRLIGEQGKAILGEHLNIIQHPHGEPRQIVLRSNELVDVFEDYLHYVTDTEPGSSGAPVHNDQWEVVALHHSGVPRTQDGQMLAKDGSIWKSGMDPGTLDWVANEGIRVSSLVIHIKGLSLAGEQARLRDALLTAQPPDLRALATEAVTEMGHGITAPGGVGSAQTWTIPLRVAVSLGEPILGAMATTPAAVVPLVDQGSPVPIAASTEEAVSIDPDYSTRHGYDPRFLGKKPEREVPLPKLSETMLKKVAHNREARAGEDSFVLPYHHFSVVMNRQRRLAFFTAVNIDGRKVFRIKREKDRWFYDPRVDQDHQTGNESYASNPLDRGHLVRRLDPAWGEDEESAKVANDDTFHFTNCTPQHAEFNQSQTTWAGLEDYLLDNAENEGMKVSVFTGPVLGRSDPPYRGVRLPLQFWKVAVMVKQGGKLSATAYLLSQRGLLADLEEEFTFGAYRTYQVPVWKIEQLTGLDFGGLKVADPLGAVKPDETWSQQTRLLDHPSEIVL